jgi:hypothetical protein
VDLSSVDEGCVVLSVRRRPRAPDRAGRPKAELDAGGARRSGDDRLHVGHDGAPKGAVLSHGNLLASVAALSIALALDSCDDRLVLLPPCSYARVVVWS